MRKAKHKKSLHEIEYNKQLRRIKNFIRNAEKRGFRFEENIIPDRPKRITAQSVSRLKKITPDSMYRRATYLNPDTDTIVTGRQGRNYERQKSAEKAARTRFVKAKERLEDEDRRFKAELERDRIEYNKRIEKYKTETPLMDFVVSDDEIDDSDDYWYEDYDEMPSDAYITLEAIREEIGKWQPQSTWSENLTKAKETDKDTLSRILEGAIATDGEYDVAKRLLDNAELVHRLINEILYSSGGSKSKYNTGRDQVNVDLVTFATIVKGHPLTVDESISLTEVTENYENEN